MFVFREHKSVKMKEIEGFIIRRKSNHVFDKLIVFP